MIISHRHKYLFVQMPHTGCTAVAKELCEHYDGEPILRKHAFYHQFLAQAIPAERDYFTFSGIRNPIDDVVAIYYKYVTNHEGYDDPKNFSERGGFVTPRMRRRHEFVRSVPDDFEAYFRKFYRIPYDNWSRLDHSGFDFVMRLESLDEDFSEALRRIGLEQVRPLPVFNKTKRPERDAAAHFPLTLRNRAHWVFGPFMRTWCYDFPVGWEDAPLPLSSRAAYGLFGLVRTLYWRRR